MNRPQIDLKSQTAIHKSTSLIECEGVQFLVGKRIAKTTLKRLQALNVEQWEYIKRTFRQRKYEAKKRGRVMDDDTIINIIINKIIV